MINISDTNLLKCNLIGNIWHNKYFRFKEYGWDVSLLYGMGEMSEWLLEIQSANSQTNKHTAEELAIASWASEWNDNSASSISLWCSDFITATNSIIAIQYCHSNALKQSLPPNTYTEYNVLLYVWRNVPFEKMLFVLKMWTQIKGAVSEMTEKYNL